MPLCEPVKYIGRQPSLFTVSLTSGQVFSIQHFSVDTDLDELYHQFYIQSTDHWDLAGLLKKFKESFQYMAGSHTSQAFIASVDREHVFEIEIHEAAAHQSQLKGYAPGKGEFFIQISAGTWIRLNHTLYAESLQQSIQYFLQFPEVHCILINTTLVPSKIVGDVLVRAGFHACADIPFLYIYR